MTRVVVNHYQSIRVTAAEGLRDVGRIVERNTTPSGGRPDLTYLPRCRHLTRRQTKLVHDAVVVAVMVEVLVIAERVGHSIPVRDAEHRHRLSARECHHDIVPWNRHRGNRPVRSPA